MREAAGTANPKELAMKAVAATNAHDIDAFAELFSDDVVFHFPDGDFEGKEAVLAYVKEGWDGFHPTYLEDSISMYTGDDPGTVIITWTLEGAFTEPIRGIQPTGKSAVHSGVNIVKVNDEGLICELTSYYDLYNLWEQMGLVPQRGGAPFKAMVLAEVAATKSKSAAGKAKEALHL